MAYKRLVIIDGYSLLFRAFFGTRYLSTADGKPTNAIFGFTSMVFNLLENEKPDAIVVAMDAPGKTFRHEAYPAYKGTRRETDEAFIQQIPTAYELIAALGIPCIEMTGFEADDVVGTLSLLAERNGYQTTIVSGDLDQLQLVDDHVQVMTTRQGVTDVVYYTPERVHERYGIPPTTLPDWKAIVGDSSDNIPGVPGIGEKGATILLQAHGTIEQLLDEFDKVEPKYAKKIEPVIEQMKQSKWLATIQRDVPISYDFEPFRVTPEQIEIARSLMESLEFRSHAKKLPIVLSKFMEGGSAILEGAVAPQSVDFTADVTSLANVSELLGWLGDAPYAVLFDTGAAQTSMFDEAQRTAYFARGDKVVTVPDTLAIEAIGKTLSQAILHDAKSLFKSLSATATTVRFDSMLAGYVLQSGRSSYALRDLVQGYLDATPPTDMPQMAVALFRLEEAMRDRLEKEAQLGVLTDIEQPLLPILAQMEMAGISVSRGYMEDLSRSLAGQIESIAEEIYTLAGQTFNIGSPKQLGDILFEKLQIPGPKKGKTGYPTGAEVLQTLAAQHPIADRVMAWREVSKLKSTYADSLPRMIGPDGRIHTSFNQTVAATGRLSSNEPNLQNIPIRTDLGRQIRKGFVAADGMVLGSFDYSQIELRVLAHMCGEPALLRAFQSGEDVHATTASLMFNEPIADVSREHRRYAKLLNFAVLYGVTDFGLANQLGGEFSNSEARELIQQYNERFPRVREFTDSIIAEAKQKGFTTTLSGRRRYFPEIHAQNRNERMYAERQAMNAPIQGTAADMIKVAMVKLAPKLSDWKARMLLQVHDELVFELPAQDTTMIEPIRKAMEASYPLNVPIEVEAKLGVNWLEMESISRA